MKKYLVCLLALAMLFSCMTGCSSGAEQAVDTSNDIVEDTVTAPVNPEDTNANAEPAPANPVEQQRQVDTKFVLEYPADMQKLGFTEPIILDRAPERIVSLSTSPVLALYELGANIVGVPISSVVVWPEELTAKADSVSFSVMSDGDFDFESVLALAPDLVFLASAAKDTAGAALESLGLTVYYVYAGHTVSYDSVKMQTQALVDAFDMSEECIAAGDSILARFSELEAELAHMQSTYKGKTVLVLQSSSTSVHYAQTKNGTLGSMLDMIGFTNVYENESSSLAQIDLEQALYYNPDYIVCVGSGNAQSQQNLMEKAFELNPEYWYSIGAVENGNVIYVDMTFISSAGINVIKNINDLMHIVSEHTEANR